MSASGLTTDAGGNPHEVVVDTNEDIGRVGFSGLLAEADLVDSAPLAAESPETWAPLAVSRGAVDASQRQGVAAFCGWLADRREATRS